MQHVMFLWYRYELLRDIDLEIGVYIWQDVKKQKRCAAKVCARGINNLPTRLIMVPF